MNSIKIRIILLTTFILGSAVGLTAWHNLRTQKALMTQITSQNGRILVEVIRNSIITNMAHGEHQQVLLLLEKISREPSIKTIRIFDETGRILLSSASEEIGDAIASTDLLAYRRGETTLSGDRHRHPYIANMLPIPNGPTCHGCHEPAKTILGILDVHFSLSELQAMQSSGREANLFSAGGILLILILTLSGFILYYVEAPIRRLVRAMDRIELGDFNQAELRMGGSAEMAHVGSKFNRMVQQLKSLLDSTVQHEREMAIAKEKLAHHEEIRRMTGTLEDRLKEIEFLNLTLEERIEEIEEANYKIADLASDLEAKNTNLAQAVTRLSALYKMGLAINSTMDHERLFDLLLNKTMEVLNARVGYILLLDKESWSLRIGAAVGVPETLDRHQFIPLRSGGVSHWVINKRQPLLIRSIDESQQFNHFSRLDFHRETVICTPLMVKDDIIGTLTIANRHDSGHFTPDDLELLSTIAAQASVAINNAGLYEEQQSLYLSTVQALVSAVEACDPYTRGHSERVTRYCLSLARHLGLPSESIRNLEQAAILHDIGKIGVDTAVLQKAEKLSGSEIDVLRQHLAIGARILEPIQFLRNTREVIEQHHERFDGSGYPKGLRGESILFEARILAVADAFDAMTSDRPYRTAMANEVAIREIRGSAGTQFDPRVAVSFIELWENGHLAS